MNIAYVPSSSVFSNAPELAFNFQTVAMTTAIVLIGILAKQAFNALFSHRNRPIKELPYRPIIFKDKVITPCRVLVETDERYDGPFLYDLVWCVHSKTGEVRRVAIEDACDRTYAKHISNPKQREALLRKIEDITYKLELHENCSTKEILSKKIGAEIISFLRTIPFEHRLENFYNQRVISANPFPRFNKITYQSRFDNFVSVNKDYMAITILARASHCCREGHAVIAYEGIYSGKPFVHYAHLKKSNDHWANVELIDDRVLSPTKNIKQSETIQRASWLVFDMIREIKRQKLKQIPFHPLGRHSAFNLKNSHNCLSWAIEMLEKAAIQICNPSFVGQIPALDIGGMGDWRDQWKWTKENRK